LILRIVSCSIVILFSSHLHLALAAEVFLIPESQLNFRVNEGGTQDKPIQVYGLMNNTEIKFLSSRLSSKDSPGYIESNNVKFNNTSSLKIHINKGEIKNVMVSVKPDKVGVFTGAVIIQNNKNDTIQEIPINLEVIPFWWPYNIVFFIIGFGASLAFWSWNRKKALEQRFTGIKKSAWELERQLYAFDAFLKEYYYYRILYGISFKDLVRDVSSSNVKDAERIIENLMQALSELIERDNFDESKLREACPTDLSIDQFIERIVSNALAFGAKDARPQSSENQDIQDAKFSYWTYLKIRKPSLLLFNASAILLGIIIGIHI
jgi:hypothetical protein